VAAASGLWVWIWQPLARHRAATQWQMCLNRIAVAAMFMLHTARMAIYLSPGHGLRGAGAKPVCSGQAGCAADKLIASLPAFPGVEGDFRDWADVDAWARSIAHALGPVPAGAH
jgi:hypothetical protein